MSITNKTRLLYLVLLAIISSLTYCIRQKPLYYEEGFKQINNTEIYYRIIGEGLPLLFVHGGPGLEHTYLLPQMKNLATDFKLIFYDQRYCGRSGNNLDPTSLTMDQFVEDLEELRSVLNLEKINLIGHSFGGLLAQYYAIRYPENLNSLVLMNTAGASSEFLYGPGNPKCQMTDKDRKAMNQLMNNVDTNNLTSELWEKYFKLQFTRYFYNKILVDSLDLSFTDNNAQNVPYVNSILLNSLGEFDIYNQLNSIECPTLIFHTGYDPVRLELIERIHNKIETSRLVYIEKCGHFPFIEAQKELFEAMKDFYGKMK